MAIRAAKRKVVVENEGNSSENDTAIDPEDSPLEEDESDRKSDSNDENMPEDDQDEAVTNAGWADSISKILKANKPKGKKTLVLSKAKKLTDVRKIRDKDVGFEIQAQNGEIKRERIEEADLLKDNKVEQQLRKKKKDLQSVRVKPNILHKDRERTLAKIATKGVVQLFNAVKQQQKVIDTKLKDAGPLEVKRDKVLRSIDKREFLNVLMGDKSHTVSKPVELEKASENKNLNAEPTWSVLREDFMMGAKMKDWDKQLEDENEVEQDVESE